MKREEEIKEAIKRIEHVEKQIKHYETVLEEVLGNIEIDLEFLSDTRGGLILTLERIENES